MIASTALYSVSLCGHDGEDERKRATPDYYIFYMIFTEKSLHPLPMCGIRSENTETQRILPMQRRNATANPLL
jgi:hypothetical protein